MAAVPIPFYEWSSTSSLSSNQDWQLVYPSLQRSHEIEKPKSLRIVTWNVWYEQVEQRIRFSGFVEEINSIPGPAVDVIALQEVTPQFLTWLRADTTIAVEWLLTDRWDEA